MEYLIDDEPTYIRFDGKRKSLAATRDIRQGEVVATIPGRTRFNPDKYSIEMAPGIHIDCEFSKVGAINHSCNPNAAIRGFRVVAWRCIVGGEEICIDYKRTETKLASPFDCECGFCDGKRIE